MSFWTWVLVGLCAAGVALTLISVIMVIRPALRLRAHLEQLKNSPLFILTESLQLQTNRLSHVAQKVTALTNRAQAAVSSMQESIKTSGTDEARDAMQESGAAVTALLDDLR